MKAMFRNRKSLKALQAALLAVGVCFSIGATDATARYEKLNHQFMCSCGCGQVLGECNHVGCPSSPVQLAELKTDMANGMTDQQIFDGFAAKYGATVLAAPTTKGFDLVAWIAPFAVFLAALLGTILLVRHWSLGKKQVEEPASTPEMTAIRERIRRETGSEGSY
jgi:cytochrome c-type biogenesis protein CcmH/NrfF